MAAFALTKDDILRHCNRQSYARGEEYYESGAVDAVVRRGNTVTAEVSGSSDDYLVTVAFQENGEIEADCDCPYDYDGWCKHIVAVMLVCLHDPAEVDEQPLLETLLLPLDRAALQTLVLKIASENPRLVDDIVLMVDSLTGLPVASAASVPASGDLLPLPPINIEAVRRKTKAALKTVQFGGYDDYGDEADSSEMEEQVGELIAMAQAHTLQGDGRSALLVLEPITDELVKGWDRVEDMLGQYGDDMCQDLGLAWAEAILTQELPEEERRMWRTRLNDWIRESSYSGLAGDLKAGVLALELGWDDPDLVRALHGDVTVISVLQAREAEEEDEEEDEDDEEYEDDYDDEDEEEDERMVGPLESAEVGSSLLATAHLNILERQGRFQEAIFLAEATGKYERYLGFLIQLGRVDEAAQQGMKYLKQPFQLLSLAQKLEGQGGVEKALEVAAYGLRMEQETPSPFGFNYYGGGKKSLADWLREYAYKHGKSELAIEAAMVGMKEAPNLTDYKRLQEISGEQWATLREQILSNVSQSKGYGSQGAVEILLHEGKNGEALEVVSNGYDTHLLARVVEKVTPTHPAEVIPLCKKQAESIMDSGKATRYEDAARWMERVREAYRVLEQMDVWQNYKEQTIAKHQRKYKLVPMLLAL